MKTFEELRAQRHAANEKIGDIYVKAANRELTDEEKLNVQKLNFEIDQCEREMKGINLDLAHEQAAAHREKEILSKAFRERLQAIRAGKADREILLKAAAGNTAANIEASGAINLTIHQLIPTLHEGLGLPQGVEFVTGVEGNEIWPVSINDVELEEVGEVDALTDQVLDFAKITPTARRVGLTIPISNAAIDNASFDVLAFVQTKADLALRDYLAKKVYSQAEWDQNKGPFSGMTAVNITLGDDAYKNILAAVASFLNKGFKKDDVCISMDNVTEAELMATPKIAGAAGGFVIENGKCAGYPYTVSHYVNTTLDNNDKLVPTTDRYLEIGDWKYFALQQHGEVRMTVDATSQAVAKKNITAVTLNLFVSMTDLSVYINGANNVSQGFGLYKIVTA